MSIKDKINLMIIKLMIPKYLRNTPIPRIILKHELTVDTDLINRFKLLEPYGATAVIECADIVLAYNIPTDCMIMYMELRNLYKVTPRLYPLVVYQESSTLVAFINQLTDFNLPLTASRSELITAELSYLLNIDYSNTLHE